MFTNVHSANVFTVVRSITMTVVLVNSRLRTNNHSGVGQ